MRSIPWFALALLAACAPPEVTLPVDTGPTTVVAPLEPMIRVIHPVQDSEVQLADDCSIDLVVAVDVDDFAVVEPAELAEGEGHWHVQLVPFDTNYQPVYLQTYRMVRTGLSAGSATIEATLVDSQHIEIGGPGTVGIVEFTFTDPVAGTCP